jgi:branched-chain amino acid transport system substrate-binding protein
MKNIWRIIGVIILIIVVVLIVIQIRKASKGLNIGAILPLTGDNARYGIWIQEALNLYIDEVNASGGINGKKIRIIYEDDQTDPKLATLAMQKLSEINRVSVVFGSWASSCVLALAPIAERNKIVIMAQAISPQIRLAGDYIFRDIPDAQYSLSFLVPFAVKKGAKNVAILFVNNDYGKDQAEVFEEKLENLGGKIVFKEGYNIDTSDFRTVLTKILATHPDSIYLPGYSEVGLILRQAKELGLNVNIYASDPFENDDILKIAGEAAEGVFYPFFYDALNENEETKLFISHYKQRYSREPEGTAALAYNGIKIIVEAVRRVGMDSTKIKDALYQFKNYKGALGEINIDNYGDMALPVYIKTVREGKFIRVQ